MKPRENPFRAEQLHALRFRFHGTDWAKFLQNLEQSQYRGAIVGPHGTGKTTLLLEVAERLRQSGHLPNYLRINSESRHAAEQRVTEWLQEADPAQILLLDGAEQLRFWAWRRVLKASRSFRGLLVTTHRPGRLPTMYRTQTDLQLLTDLVKELTGETDAHTERLQELFQRHHGNVRECLRTLYELSSNSC